MLIGELEARAARLEELNDEPQSTERVIDSFQIRSPRASRVDDIYDMTTVDRTSNERMVGDLRDRAMRSVEAAQFPPQVVRSQAQEHIERLIAKHDSDDQIEIGNSVGGEVSRRILSTGSPLYKRAWTKYMKSANGSPVLSHEEQRALSVGTGNAGGFAIVYTLDPTIIPTSNLSVNPYREFCNVETIAGTNEWRGVTSAGVTATRRAEAAATTDASPTLAQPSIVVSKVDCFVPASIELTQDWNTIETDLASLIVDAKDDEEATSFTTGTYGAATSPGGLQASLTTTQRVQTAGTAAFVLADLYKLWEAVPPRFRPRAAWVGNLFSYDKVRQFDTAGGAGLWLQNLQIGAGAAGGNGASASVTASNLLSRPAYESTAMTGALTTGTKLFIVGDGRYFKIIDRIGMDIEVIPHLFGASQGNLPTGQRGFYAYWRNSSKVLDANGFRYLETL